jgi:hypothetical protein
MVVAVSLVPVIGSAREQVEPLLWASDPRGSPGSLGGRSASLGRPTVVERVRSRWSHDHLLDNLRCNKLNNGHSASGLPLPRLSFDVQTLRDSQKTRTHL